MVDISGTVVYDLQVCRDARLSICESFASVYRLDERASMPVTLASLLVMKTRLLCFGVHTFVTPSTE